MESEQTEVVKQEPLQDTQDVQQPTIEAPNSMTDPTTPEIKSAFTNAQLNQLISKMDAISNQQILIYEKMKEQKENNDKGGSNDGLKY